ncbi:hypothetical protein L7F22_030378 [Adiantum nelumboides]|nr:hypothetical protein [Adiantum nelumboides]
MNALEGLDVSTLQALSIMMRSCNPYADAFYNVGRLLRDTSNAEIRMTICENRSSSRQYRIPVGNEVAAIMPGQGEDGWHLKLPCADVDVPTDALTNRQCVSQREYYAYRLQVFPDTNACLLCGGRLLQQFMVDAYYTIEDCSLSWIRNHQHTLRAELYAGLIDMARSSKGDILGQSVGRRIVLPSSFTGGPWHMYQLCQDAMIKMQWQ